MSHSVYLSKTVAYLSVKYRKQNTAITIGKSIINKNSKANIGDICLKYGGGGHRNAGTCQIPNDKVDEILPKIIEELKVLREVKKTAISCLFEEDIVDLHMRIAFADITDYVDFKSKVKPVLNKSGGFVYATNPKTEEKVLLTYTDNEVTVKDSTEVDGLIINEISQGRNGLKIKLADRMKSLEFLERYFELNPQDKHKIAYDNAKLEIEREKLSLVKDKDNVEIEDTDETDDMIYGEDLS